MSRLKIVLAVLLIAVIGSYSSWVYLKNTGNDQIILMGIVSYLLKPSELFDPNGMAKKPNYAEDRYWSSLPERGDEADLVPIGLEGGVNNGNAPVDVFYIHGTGYLNNNSWTSPIKPNTATEDNAKFSLANEASIFNSCCNIYAPHYREASIFTYMSLSSMERENLLDYVYEDIANAFEYFIKLHNENRPIVIVSHSQGTHLAIRLLSEIDGSPEIAERVVVAYMVGSGPVSLTQSYIDSLQNFNTCEKSRDIHCVVHWNSYGENGTKKIFSSPEPSLCTNPLSWSVGDTLAPSSLNLGAVPISGAYTMKMVGDDSSSGIVFNRHQPAMVGYSWAYCRDGYLYVSDQTGSDYEKLGKLPDKSYHGIDFPLFHMNIRTNVSERIDEYFQSRLKTQ